MDKIKSYHSKLMMWLEYPVIFWKKTNNKVEITSKGSRYRAVQIVVLPTLVMSWSPCTPEAFSLSVERQILGVKISRLLIHMRHAHCKRLDAALR